MCNKQNLFGVNYIRVIFLFFLISCGSKQVNITDMVTIPATAGKGLDKENLPQMKFEEDIFDFGTITQGEKKTHEFKFTNTGKSDLIIANAYADCGCTVAEVPKAPVPPGGENNIRVSFDSEGKQGIVTKSVTILTNCVPNKRIIKIKANIFVPTTTKSN